MSDLFWLSDAAWGYLNRICPGTSPEHGVSMIDGSSPAFSRKDVCAFHYSNSYTTAAHDGDAARRTHPYDQGTPVGWNRSVVQQIRFTG